MLIISSCSNNELVTKLLEMRPAVADKPTVEELEKVIIAFDAQHREDPRIAEIMAAATSTPYKEAVRAKLDGLTANEIKKLPIEHGAKEYQKWWNMLTC